MVDREETVVFFYDWAEMVQFAHAILDEYQYMETGDENNQGMAERKGSVFRWR